MIRAGYDDDHVLAVFGHHNYGHITWSHNGAKPKRFTPIMH